MLSDLVERLRAAIDGGSGPITIDADGVEALLDDRDNLAVEVDRLRAVVASLAGALRAFVDHDQYTLWHDPPKPSCPCKRCRDGRAALAAADDAKGDANA